jgi:hypothetical protein
LRSVERQRLPVHASHHAAVDAARNGDFLAGACVVARVLCVQPEQGKPELFGPGFKVTVAARQIIAGVAMRDGGHLRSDMGIGRGDEIASRRTSRPNSLSGNAPTSGTVHIFTVSCAVAAKGPSNDHATQVNRAAPQQAIRVIMR